MRKTMVLIGGWICMTVIGCGPPLKPPQDGEFRAAVSIVPQAWLVKKIGGEHVEVSSLAKPGEDPHTYSPTDAEVSQLMRSRVYFRIGVPFERGNWFDTIVKSKTLEVVDCRQGIELREIEAHHHHDHDHDHDHAKEEKAADAGKPDEKAKATESKKKSSGHDHDHDHDHDHGHAHDHGHHHDHEGGDPHIWLTPKLLKIQAHTIADALAKLDPANKDAYKANLEAFEKEADEIDAQIRKQLEPHKGKAFFIFHPAWGYFADEYGLRQIAIEVEGKEPSDHELTEVQELAKKEKAKVVFVQPQIAGRSAEAVAKVINGRVERIDPLAEDVFASLKQAADAITASFE